MKCFSLFLLISIILLSCKTSKSAKTIATSPSTDTGVAIAPAKSDTVSAVAEIKNPVQPVINNSKTDVFLEDLLKSGPENFNNIISNRDSFKVQIIYTRIDRQADNNPVFKSYFFNVNHDTYFYPASTVKMPVALMALQRLNELKVFGLNRYSSMITESSYGGQTSVYNDPTTPDGRPSITQYIKKIFLASDNDAFNRLYEFLGQQYINERLHGMGYENAEILHRLDISLTEDENRHCNPVKFFSESGKSLYSQPMQVSELVYLLRNDSVGKGYLTGEKLTNSPMTFSNKNRLGLEDLTGILKSILFPAMVPVKQRFNLKAEDYRFIYQFMSQFPGESLYPSYDSSSYPDAYLKFLLYGSEKDSLPKNIRIFNKSGNAYGFLTDVAYIADFDKNIEFMLSATIYCNGDGILNDDNYDYDTVGFPFMKELGKLIYEYELKRERTHRPDLSSFKMIYDKKGEE
ncbi:MAG: serine hydrolase [Chitinophagaceae bacterium]